MYLNLRHDFYKVDARSGPPPFPCETKTDVPQSLGFRIASLVSSCADPALVRYTFGGWSHAIWLVGDQTAWQGLCRSLYPPQPSVAHGSGPTAVSCTNRPIPVLATYGQEVARPLGRRGLSCRSLDTRNGGRRVDDRGRKGDRGAPGRPRTVQRVPSFRRNSV